MKSISTGVIFCSENRDNLIYVVNVGNTQAIDSNNNNDRVLEIRTEPKMPGFHDLSNINQVYTTRVVYAF